MRNVNSDTITATFLSYFGANTDPRMQQLMECLAEHLHAFVRETQLTHEEWQTALEFLRRTGEMTTDERNEFVLLSDVLGVSSLVDMVNSAEGGTSSSVLGPFHIAGAPPIAQGADLKGNHDGELVLVEGCVKDPRGEPIPGAVIDVWQTAPNGLYSSQDPDQDTYSFHGLMTTDERGYYAFTTAKPVPYTVPTDGPVGQILNATGRHPWRPSHLHYIVTADGYRPLVTEVFPSDDPYLDQDTVFGVRDDLVMRYESRPAGSFPDGFALSGKVDQPYLRVNFDLILTQAVAAKEQ